MAYDFQVVIDAAGPHALAEWWADALGWQVEPQDEAFIRELVNKGHASEEDVMTYNGALVWRSGAAIRHPDGLERAPRVLFQLVPEPTPGKNRAHLDIRAGAGNIEAEVGRLTARGAKELHRGRQGANWWVTLADPEGNEFCVS
ncbi:VOC family protein [Nonomuraea sp. NPDC050404]|uniref:VOC family protein n=1 Tax=Nonomuraea sp. NPDC050404 TaxID=3155783 RepID=UPI0033EE2394